MSGKVLLKDFMTKRSRMRNKRFLSSHFNNRWFELTETSLNYYDGDLEKGPGNLKGSIKLSSITVIEKAQGFNKNYLMQVGHILLQSDGYEFCNLYISCVHENQRGDWILALRNACITRGCTFNSNYHEGVWLKKSYICCGNEDINSKGCKKTSSNNSASLNQFKWYYADFSKLQAKELLVKDGREGCFLVRDSKRAGLLVLVVLTKNKTKATEKQRFEGKSILQFHIKSDDNKSYYLTKDHVFDSADSLIQYFQCNSSGLPCRLKCYPRDLEDFSDLVSGVITEGDLHFQEDIGHGQFGLDTKAIYKNREVAVKQLKGDAHFMDDQEFLEEARFMISFDHPNLVKLLGICLTQPIKIVTEYMKHGALAQFLKKYKDILKLDSKKTICLQVCSGMKYLESKKIIHRDLAARNCLVGEKQSIKICDFGLSRRVIDDEYNSSSDFYFSIRWSSPESLTLKKFSSKSDVWSFGILMWEVFVCGQTPYSNIKDNKEVRRLVSSANIKLDQPENCPDDVYRIMQECWRYEPEERPSFHELINNFETRIYGESDDM